MPSYKGFVVIALDGEGHGESATAESQPRWIGMSDDRVDLAARTYRNRVAECYRRAALARSPDIRTSYLSIAKHYALFDLPDDLLLGQPRETEHEPSA
jgi:hypothetical protein